MQVTTRLGMIAVMRLQEVQANQLAQMRPEKPVGWLPLSPP
jgi:hypothetical protein